MPVTAGLVTRSPLSTPCRSERCRSPLPLLRRPRLILDRLCRSRRGQRQPAPNTVAQARSARRVSLDRRHPSPRVSLSQRVFSESFLQPRHSKSCPATCCALVTDLLEGGRTDVPPLCRAQQPRRRPPKQPRPAAPARPEAPAALRPPSLTRRRTQRSAGPGRRRPTQRRRSRERARPVRKCRGSRPAAGESGGVISVAHRLMALGALPSGPIVVFARSDPISLDIKKSESKLFPLRGK